MAVTTPAVVTLPPLTFPVTDNDPKVPTAVMLVWLAVIKVPAIFVADRLPTVALPVADNVPEIAVPELDITTTLPVPLMVMLAFPLAAPMLISLVPLTIFVPVVAIILVS